MMHTVAERAVERPKAAAAWVSAGTGARLIGRSTKVVTRLGKVGRVRMHSPPGLRALYHRGDLEALAPPAA